MNKATESMFDGKKVLIPLAEVSYVVKSQNCIEVGFKDSTESLILVQPDKNAFISAWRRYRGEVEAHTLMDLDGAQPAPSDVRKVVLGFRWDSEAQCHIPTLEVEFDPVPAEFPNDAKGWQDRDRLAAWLKGIPAQPAPSIPEGWLRAIDEALVVAHIGVANASDTYEQAKMKLNSLIGLHVDVATDPAVNGGWQLVPIEPTQEMRNAWDSSPICEDDDAEFRRAYSAMLAATPEAKP